MLAPDYFGFGRSDKPVEREWYSYDRHYASIERFVDELDLRDLTVVVHDWGGPLGLRLAAERPERVARLVITNTGLYAGRPPSDEWLRFREFVRRRRDRPAAGPARADQLRERGARRGRRRLRRAAPDARVEDRAADVPGARPDRAGASVRRRRCCACARRSASWRKPALVVFSDSDPIFSPRVGERFAELIPGAELGEPIAGAGHFLAEDEGEELGRADRPWLGSGGAARCSASRAGGGRPRSRCRRDRGRGRRSSRGCTRPGSPAPAADSADARERGRVEPVDAVGALRRERDVEAAGGAGLDDPERAGLALDAEVDALPVGPVEQHDEAERERARARRTPCSPRSPRPGW